MLSDCTITSHAKFVIAGEHAVLRGHPALACPIPTLTLSLSYQAQPSPLQITFANNHSELLEALFQQTLAKGLSNIGKSIKTLTGSFNVNSNIPIGANLGASAALCVAITKWIAAQGWISVTPPVLCNFATQLENLFHGESSGMDIATVLATQPILFERAATLHSQPVTLAWQPLWYLSSCQNNSTTAQCVNQVKTLFTTNHALAQQLDQQMHHAVTQALAGLNTSKIHGFSLLQNAIQSAADCFKQWGLISKPLATHIDRLYQHGASAVKPTGAGNGGYVLSLWEKPPPDSLGNQLLQA